MLQYYYHCVLKLKDVYGACQIRSHRKSGNHRSSESAVLSLEWFVFSRKGAPSVLLQLKGRRWLSGLIIQNLISVHPSVVSVSLPQLCLVSWRPYPLWLNACRGKCFSFCQGGCTGWEGRSGSLLLLVHSFNTSVNFQLYSGPVFPMCSGSGRKNWLASCAGYPSSCCWLSVFSGLLARFTCLCFAVSKILLLSTAIALLCFLWLCVIKKNLSPTVVLVEF